MKRWTLPILLACTSCFEAKSEDRRQETQQAPAQEVLVQRPPGPISDGADIIPPSDEAILDKRLRAVFDETHTALIVVTVPTLGGQDVAAYTNLLARQWEVGGDRGGVVFLIAPSERKMRIEVSDKVEDRLTNQECADILEKVVTPRFSAGDLVGGIAAGEEAIASQF